MNGVAPSQFRNRQSDYIVAALVEVGRVTPQSSCSRSNTAEKCTEGAFVLQVLF